MRRLFGAVLLLLASLCAAHAQSYPSSTIKVILPFTPGSPVDAVCRVIMHHLQGRLSQTIVVDNRAGGRDVGA